jgi:site-specific recombinase XerD
MKFRKPRIKAVLFASKQLKDGRFPVLIRVTLRGKRKYLATGVSAFPEEWNEEASELNTSASSGKVRRSGAVKMNKMISTMLVEVERIVNRMDDSFTLDALDSFKKKLDDFEEYINGVIKRMNENGQVGNAMTYQTALNRLKSYKKDLRFEKLTPKFFEGFDSWLISEGVSNNTRSNYFRTIRAGFNKAIQEGVINDDRYPFARNKTEKKKFLISTIQTTANPKGLSFEEVQRFKTYSPQTEIEKEAQSFFMLCFYLRGISPVDLCERKWSDIHGGRFQYTRKKTRSRKPIELNVKVPDKAEPFLAYFRQFKRDYILPPYEGGDVQSKGAIFKRKDYFKRINKALKEIALKLELPLSLTLYWSRHSYAKLISEGGASLEVIREGLGHSDISTTGIYLRSLNTNEVDDQDQNLP